MEWLDFKDNKPMYGTEVWLCLAPILDELRPTVQRVVWQDCFAHNNNIIAVMNIPKTIKPYPCVGFDRFSGVPILATKNNNKEEGVAK